MQQEKAQHNRISFSTNIVFVPSLYHSTMAIFAHCFSISLWIFDNQKAVLAKINHEYPAEEAGTRMNKKATPRYPTQ